MRFYFITITLFSLTLNLAAQPADTVELSSRQIAQIQDQGAAGIQAVIEESNIDLQDKAATHELVSQIVSSQINKASTPESIAEITSQITIAVAEIALMGNYNDQINLIIESISAGANDGVIKASENLNIDVRDAIKYASSGSSSGAIKIAIANGLDVAAATSAAASGATAGAIEAALETSYNVPEIVEFASSGSVVGTISAAEEAGIDVRKYIEAAAAGSVEAAVEVPASKMLDIMKFVQYATAGSIKATIESDIETYIDEHIKAAFSGSTFGAKQAIAGKGSNTRIKIAPISVDLNELEQTLEYGLIDGERRAKRFEINITPYDDDPSVRQVSPV